MARWTAICAGSCDPVPLVILPAEPTDLGWDYQQAKHGFHVALLLLWILIKEHWAIIILPTKTFNKLENFGGRRKSYSDFLLGANEGGKLCGEGSHTLYIFQSICGLPFSKKGHYTLGEEGGKKKGFAHVVSFHVSLLCGLAASNVKEQE